MTYCRKQDPTGIRLLATLPSKWQSFFWSHRCCVVIDGRCIKFFFRITRNRRILEYIYLEEIMQTLLYIATWSIVCVLFTNMMNSFTKMLKCNFFLIQNHYIVWEGIQAVGFQNLKFRGLKYLLAQAGIQQEVLKISYVFYYCLRFL